MPTPEWRTVIRWLIIRDGGADVLTLAGALPETELPGQLEEDEPEVPLAALRAATGLQAVVLALHAPLRDEEGEVPTRRLTWLATLLPGSPLPPEAAWTRPDAPAGPPDSGPPWTSPAWHAEVTTWLADALAARGGSLLGPLVQVRVWELSSVLRAATSGGTVYVKSSIATPLFAEEGTVLATLAELFPGQVPTLLAVDAGRRLVALDEFGPEVGNTVEAETHARVLAQYADLQVGSAAHLDRLLAAGCRDRTLPWLAGQAATWPLALDPDRPRYGCAAEDWLTPQEVEAVHALAPELAEAAERLAGYGLPDSLVHGDLHLGNVATAGERYLFFDWTDAAVGHPFLDLISLYWQHSEDVRDAYLSRWTAYGPSTAWSRPGGWPNRWRPSTRRSASTPSPRSCPPGATHNCRR
ncbi:phosphotransferase [Nonomuraea sp. NPDC050328]|uniref:phosphotransferase n=1 Tax=Nonomuraea sp. NPDC050328 TaxID=3364361 RepID=UPI0037BAF9A6